MAFTVPDANITALLNRQHIAALATQNDDSFHLTTVWHLFSDENLRCDVFPRARKLRSIAARDCGLTRFAPQPIIILN